MRIERGNREHVLFSQLSPGDVFRLEPTENSRLCMAVLLSGQGDTKYRVNLGTGVIYETAHDAECFPCDLLLSY